MKTFISILIIFFGVLMSGSFSSSKEKSLHNGGRCTGSSNCSACSNCSGCAHCASGGGSCGVCGGGSYKKKPSAKHLSSKHQKSKTPNTSPSYRSKKSKISEPPKIRIDEVNIKTDKRYIANISVIKIYEKPSLQSAVIEKVSKTTKLILISKQKYWQKVKVQKSWKTGYVYYKDVK